MNNPLDDLLNVLEEFEAKDLIEINGKKVRASRCQMILPCNDRGELIGLDHEVAAFHARLAGIEIMTNRWVPFDPNKIYIMERPTLPDAMIDSPIGFYPPPRVADRIRIPVAGRRGGRNK